MAKNNNNNQVPSLDMSLLNKGSSGSSLDDIFTSSSSQQATSGGKKNRNKNNKNTNLGIFGRGLGVGIASIGSGATKAIDDIADAPITIGNTVAKTVDKLSGTARSGANASIMNQLFNTAKDTHVLGNGIKQYENWVDEQQQAIMEDNPDSKFAQTVYKGTELAESAGRMLPTIGVSAGVGAAMGGAELASIANVAQTASAIKAAEAVQKVSQAAGLGAMWLGVFDSQVDAAMDEGKDFGYASKKAFADATIEVATELMFGGIAGLAKGEGAVGKVASKIVDIPAVKTMTERFGASKTGVALGKVSAGYVKMLEKSRLLQNLTGQSVVNGKIAGEFSGILGEAIEEMVSEIVSPGFERLLTGDTKKNIPNANIEQVLEAGLGGALLSVMMSPAGKIQQNIIDKQAVGRLENYQLSDENIVATINQVVMDGGIHTTAQKGVVRSFADWATDDFIEKTTAIPDELKTRFEYITYQPGVTTHEQVQAYMQSFADLYKEVMKTNMRKATPLAVDVLERIVESNPAVVEATQKVESLTTKFNQALKGLGEQLSSVSSVGMDLSNYQNILMQRAAQIAGFKDYKDYTTQLNAATEERNAAVSMFGTPEAIEQALSEAYQKGDIETKFGEEAAYLYGEYLDRNKYEGFVDDEGRVVTRTKDEYAQEKYGALDFTELLKTDSEAAAQVETAFKQSRERTEKGISVDEQNKITNDINTRLKESGVENLSVQYKDGLGTGRNAAYDLDTDTIYFNPRYAINMAAADYLLSHEAIHRAFTALANNPEKRKEFEDALKGAMEITGYSFDEWNTYLKKMYAHSYAEDFLDEVRKENPKLSVKDAMKEATKRAAAKYDALGGQEVYARFASYLFSHNSLIQSLANYNSAALADLAGLIDDSALKNSDVAEIAAAQNRIAGVIHRAMQNAITKEQLEAMGMKTDGMVYDETYDEYRAKTAALLDTIAELQYDWYLKDPRDLPSTLQFQSSYMDANRFLQSLDNFETSVQDYDSMGTPLGEAGERLASEYSAIDAMIGEFGEDYGEEFTEPFSRYLDQYLMTPWWGADDLGQRYRASRMDAASTDARGMQALPTDTLIEVYGKHTFPTEGEHQKRLRAVSDMVEMYMYALPLEDAARRDMAQGLWEDLDGYYETARDLDRGMHRHGAPDADASEQALAGIEERAVEFLNDVRSQYDPSITIRALDEAAEDIIEEQNAVQRMEPPPEEWNDPPNLYAENLYESLYETVYPEPGVNWRRPYDVLKKEGAFKFADNFFYKLSEVIAKRNVGERLLKAGETVDDFVARTVKNGVSPDEIHFSGADDYVKSHPDATREELLAYLMDAAPRLEVQRLVRPPFKEYSTAKDPSDYGKDRPLGGENYQVFQFTYPLWRTYYPVHSDFGENTVIETRTTDYRDQAGRKWLFLEEIQSDLFNDVGRRKKRKEKNPEIEVIAHRDDPIAQYPDKTIRAIREKYRNARIDLDNAKYERDEYLRMNGDMAPLRRELRIAKSDLYRAKQALRKEFLKDYYSDSKSFPPAVEKVLENIQSVKASLEGTVNDVYGSRYHWVNNDRASALRSLRNDTSFRRSIINPDYERNSWVLAGMTQDEIKAVREYMTKSERAYVAHRLAGISTSKSKKNARAKDYIAKNQNVKQIENELKNLRKGLLGTERGRELEQRVKTAAEAVHTASIEYRTINKWEGALPEAPYGSNRYVDIVAKMMVQYAINNGYDGIAYTPSRMQTERWSKASEQAYINVYDRALRKALDKIGKKYGLSVSEQALVTSWKGTNTPRQSTSFTLAGGVVSQEDTELHSFGQLAQELNSAAEEQNATIKNPVIIDAQTGNLIRRLDNSRDIDALDNRHRFDEGQELTLEFEVVDRDGNTLGPLSVAITTNATQDFFEPSGYPRFDEFIEKDSDGKFIGVLTAPVGIFPAPGLQFSPAMIEGIEKEGQSLYDLSDDSMLPPELEDAFEEAWAELVKGQTQRIADATDVFFDETGSNSAPGMDSTMGVDGIFAPKDEELNRQWQELGGEYGTFEGTDIPKKFDADKAVSKLTRTVATQADLPQSAREEVPHFVLDGLRGTVYPILADKETLDAANRWLVNKYEKVTPDGQVRYDLTGAMQEYVTLSEAGKADDKRTIVKGEVVARAMQDKINELEGSTNPDDQAQVKQLVRSWSKLIAALSVDAHRAGQAVQAFSLLKKIDATGRLYYIQRAIDDIRTSLENTKVDFFKSAKKQLEAMEGLEDSAEYQEAVKQMAAAQTAEQLEAAEQHFVEVVAAKVPPTITSRFVAWRYLSMLGNVRTHERNVLSNLASYIATGLTNKVSGLAQDVAKDVFGKEFEATATNKEITQETKDFVKQRWEVSGRALYETGGKMASFKTRVQQAQRSFGDNFMGRALQGIYDFNNEGVQGIKDTGVGKTLIDVFGEDVGTDNRISGLLLGGLEGEDTYFGKMAYIRAMQNYITANNIDVSVFSNPEAMRTTKVQDLLGQIDAYAMKMANQATYHEASLLANKLNEIEKASPLGQLLVGGIAPFKRTPINILKQGAMYSPIGIAVGINQMFKQVKQGKMAAGEAISNICMGMTGTMIAILGMFLKAAGFLKAGGKDSDREEYYDEMLGHQKYSLQIGDTNYTLDWLTPVSMPLFAGATLMEEVEALNNDEDTEVISFADVLGAIGSTFDPLTNLSLLSGINDALSAYGDDNKLMQLGLSATESFATQFIPTLSGQLARSIDPVRRTTYASKDSTNFLGTRGEKLLRRIASKIPGLSQTNEPYIDMWGREDVREGGFIKRFANQALVPWYSAKANATSVDDRLSEVFAEAGTATVLPATPNSYYTINGKTMYLSPSDYTKVKEIVGRLSYNGVDTATKYSVFNQQDADTKADIISDIYSFTRTYAKYQWLLSKGVSEKQISEILSKSDIGKVTKAQKAIESGLTLGQYYTIKKLTGQQSKKKEKVSLMESYGLSSDQMSVFLD